MLEDPHSWVPESLIEVLKSCTRMLRSTSELVKLEQFLSTSGVKQGDNLVPLYLCHPRSIQHSRQEMGFHNP
jgi:hypothetical protein